MIKFLKGLTYLVVCIIMITLTVIAGFSPNALIQILNYPELDMASRIVGCIIAIPMLRLTFLVLDKTFNLLEK